MKTLLTLCLIAVGFAAFGTVSANAAPIHHRHHHYRHHHHHHNG